MTWDRYTELLAKYFDEALTHDEQKELSEIRGNLKKVHPLLKNIAIHRVKELKKTIAGKTPTSIHRQPVRSGR